MPVLTTTVGRRQLLSRGALALVLSLVVNWILLGVVLTSGVVSAFRALSFPPVTILTAAGVIGAVLVYAFVDRRYAHPNEVFVRIAFGALVVSFVPDLAVLLFEEEATVGAVVVLMSLHVPPAVICILTVTGTLTALFE